MEPPRTRRVGDVRHRLTSFDRRGAIPTSCCTRRRGQTRRVPTRARPRATSFPRLSAPPRAPPHFQTFDPPLSLRISADIIPTRLDRRFNPDGCHRSRAGSARRRQGTTLTDADPPPAASRGATRPTRDDTRTQPRDPRIDPQEHSFLGHQSGVTGESFCPPKIYIWKMTVADDVTLPPPTAEFARS